MQGLFSAQDLRPITPVRASSAHQREELWISFEVGNERFRRNVTADLVVPALEKMFERYDGRFREAAPAVLDVG